MVEEGGVVVNQGREDVVDLPPGFRFHPTDEEIITHYLKEKVFNIRFTAAAIGQADLNKNEPWDLPSKSSQDLIYVYRFKIIHQDSDSLFYFFGGVQRLQRWGRRNFTSFVRGIGSTRPG